MITDVGNVQCSKQMFKANVQCPMFKANVQSKCSMSNV